MRRARSKVETYDKRMNTQVQGVILTVSNSDVLRSTYFYKLHLVFNRNAKQTKNDG